MPSRDWSTGFCELTNPDSSMCCEGLLCTYCQIGYQYNRTEKPTIEMNAMVCLGTLVLDVCLTQGLARMAATFMIRQALQRRYGIKEELCSDVLLVCCCTHCVLCQQHREMTYHGEYPGGVLTNVPASNFAVQPPPAHGMMTMGYHPNAPNHQPQYPQPGAPAGGYPAQRKM